MRELPDEEIEQDYFRLFRVELKVGEWGVLPLPIWN
jgi:hypothetical protein